MPILLRLRDGTVIVSIDCSPGSDAQAAACVLQERHQSLRHAFTRSQKLGTQGVTGSRSGGPEHV